MNEKHLLLVFAGDGEGFKGGVLISEKETSLRFAGERNVYVWCGQIKEKHLCLVCLQVMVRHMKLVFW